VPIAPANISFGVHKSIPVAQEHHLRAAKAASRSPNYLFEELAERLKSGGARFRLVVQVAASGDPIGDARQTCPKPRESLVELRTIEVREIAQNSDALPRTLVFDPMHLIGGIEPRTIRCLKLAPGPIRCRIEYALRLPDRHERAATQPVATFGSVRLAI
jgi:catalase